MSTNEIDAYPPPARSVLNLLRENNIVHEVRCFEKPARQASQAAALVGCPLGAIVKSLVFQKQNSGGILLALVSGQNRADTQILSRLAGEPVQTAKPDVVLATTGYPVGAVPPFGVEGDYPVMMDADLLQFSQVWASAGVENILMALSPTALQALTHARLEQIKQEKG